MQIHVLDTHQLGHAGIIAATALETNDGLVLFDCGPESTFDRVAAATRAFGARPDDVRHVFLSHIHFDHAGAAWRFAELGATVYVHPRGAPHLADPAKLVESATRLFGDDMQRLWGTFAPVPGDRLRVVNDGDVIRVPPFEVRVVETPGHANHHHVYAWDDAVFGGDIAGVKIGSGPPIPPMVPPELHIESWLVSLEKLRALDTKALYLPHFGRVNGDIAGHIDAVGERVRRWADWFREQIRCGSEDAELAARFAEYEHADLRANGATADDVAGYEAADPSFMAVPAATRYWRKFHPDALRV